MPMSEGYMTWEYSGGAGNSDQGASLGGAASGVEVGAQATSAVSNITGATILYAAANALGDGALAYSNTTGDMTWQESGGTVGPAQTVGSDGRYTLFTGDGSGGAGEGYVVVDVTSANLPGADASDTITITQPMNTVWDDVDKQDAIYGDVEYRCLYLYNRWSSTIYSARVWVAAQPSGADELDLGLDPAGVGDGTSTGVAQTVADEDTEPSSVSWSRPVDYTNGLVLGDLAPGECRAVWLRRTVVAGTTTVDSTDLFRIGFGAQY
jgi:hypothetical protein